MLSLKKIKSIEFKAIVYNLLIGALIGFVSSLTDFFYIKSFQSFFSFPFALHIIRNTVGVAIFYTVILYIIKKRKRKL